LKVYWDGKLKEVEKDNNFYISTPIKNKVFPILQTQKNNLNLLNIDLVKGDPSINLFGKKDFNDSNLPNIFLKKIKSQLDEGALKNSFSVKDTTNFYINTPETLTLENIFLEYRFIKNFYNKNTSKVVSSLDNSADL